MAVVRVFAVDAVGGDFDGAPVDEDGDGAVLEAGFDDGALAEDAQDLLRGGAGADVPVFGVVAQQAVAYAASHDVGFKAVFFEFAEDLCCGFGDADGGGKAHVAGWMAEGACSERARLWVVRGWSKVLGWAAGMRPGVISRWGERPGPLPP